MPTARLLHDPPIGIHAALAHPAHEVGIVVIEGYTPTITNGVWSDPYSDGDAQDPAHRLARNRCALRDQLGDEIARLRNLLGEAATVFANTESFRSAGRPARLTYTQSIWARESSGVQGGRGRAAGSGERVSFTHQ